MLLIKQNECICHLTGLYAFPSKGQIKSEWTYEIINLLKNDPKHLKDFCPIYCKNSQGRNPSTFLSLFLDIDDFINSIWLNLTFNWPHRSHYCHWKVQQGTVLSCQKWKNIPFEWYIGCSTKWLGFVTEHCHRYIFSINILLDFKVSFLHKDSFESFWKNSLST